MILCGFHAFCSLSPRGVAGEQHMGVKLCSSSYSLSRVIEAIDKSGRFQEEAVFHATPKIQPFASIWT